ncbi:unnamed protein product, partial [Mesorhabditis belari]|uniref:Uncharacterized protein n=1 Tax=Mesorhabditis belari TaxID=2138241 RepID=A0A915H3W9_9BILA
MDPNVRSEAGFAMAERIAFTDPSELRIGGKLIKRRPKERIEDYPSVKYDKKKGNQPKKTNFSEIFDKEVL